MRRIAVVGASVAGVSAADALRQEGYDGDLVLVGAETHLPYDRPPLSKDALRSGPSAVEALLKPASWYDDQDVRLELGRPAVALDAVAQEVVLAGGARLQYDGLVLATGSVVRRPPVAGPIHTLRSLSDAQVLRDELRPGRHLVVIGAGFIGLEVAATSRELGLDVSVVELAPAPLARVMGPETGRWFADLHRRHGVAIYCNATIDRVESSTRGCAVRLGDGTSITADVVAAGTGVTPALDWLAGSGVALGDGVLCDPALRTTLPNVVAAGDIARWHHPLFGISLRIEQWRNAVQQGQHAARTLLGASEAYAQLPYFWSDQYDAKIHSVGLLADADTVSVQRLDDAALTVAFGRDGVVRGALCVNAPRDLMRFRQAIQGHAPWAG